MGLMDSDIARTLCFDFLRATEGAALNAFHWLGKGNKEAADEAACDAIRGMFDLMDIRGKVVIGEGIKDNAPGIFQGEKLGKWRENSPEFHIALDPIDGTTNLSKGMSNSISCIAAAIPTKENPNALLDIPAFYLNKLAYSKEVRIAWLNDPTLPISLDATFQDMVKSIAKILNKSHRDVVVMILDRERNYPYVEAARQLGVKIRMIADGDITAALAPALPESGVDIYMGIGGSPEGVLSAAALRCLGGGLQAKIWPRDDIEKQTIIDAGWRDKLDKTFLSKDLAAGENIIFCATGISNSPLLKGVSLKAQAVQTHSIMIRVASNTTRFMETFHNIQTKKIQIRSANKEISLADL